MQANVGRETSAEQTVRQFLNNCGLRFRKDSRPLPTLRCAADIVFPKAKLCIFIDGCFWHGCPIHFRVPASNAAWWEEKIEANRVRDRRNDRLLQRSGWRVVRVWEHSLSPHTLAKLAVTIRRKLKVTKNGS